MKISYHGHSCFELSDGSSSVIIDPFLKPANPKAVLTPEEVDPDHIVVTHGHVDHIAHAAEIAKRRGIAATAHVEVAEWLGKQGVEIGADLNLGGTARYDWGWVKLVQAFHSNTLPDGTVVGQAAGALVNIGGKTVYHLGDTALFGDLKLIGETNQIDAAIVPIGGHYTMDRHDAVHAVRLIGAPVVIPTHYNTFPPIETDAAAFKADAEAATGAAVVVLDPGGSHVM